MIVYFLYRPIYENSAALDKTLLVRGGEEGVKLGLCLLTD